MQIEEPNKLRQCSAEKGPVFSAAFEEKLLPEKPTETIQTMVKGKILKH
jgi:hypothetical protein